MGISRDLSRRSMLKQVLSGRSWRKLNGFVPEALKMLFGVDGAVLDGSAEEEGLRLGRRKKKRSLNPMSCQGSVEENHNPNLHSMSYKAHQEEPFKMDNATKSQHETKGE